MRHALLWIDSRQEIATKLNDAAKACAHLPVSVCDVAMYKGADASAPRLFTPDGGERTEPASILAYLRTGDELVLT